MGISVFVWIVGVALIGFIVWVVQRPSTPIAPPFKTIILWGAVIAVIVFTLYCLGLWDKLFSIKMPRL